MKPSLAFVDVKASILVTKVRLAPCESVRTLMRTGIQLEYGFTFRIMSLQIQKIKYQNTEVNSNLYSAKFPLGICKKILSPLQQCIQNWLDIYAIRLHRDLLTLFFCRAPEDAFDNFGNGNLDAFSNFSRGDYILRTEIYASTNILHRRGCHQSP